MIYRNKLLNLNPPLILYRISIDFIENRGIYDHVAAMERAYLLAVKDAVSYVAKSEYDAEKVSIVALYRVLKRGVQIGEHGNHKMRGIHTVTFAAPVVLNGIRGNMAVVVNMRNNKYKVHRILMPDGSFFRFEETKKECSTRIAKGSAQRVSCQCHKCYIQYQYTPS